MSTVKTHQHYVPEHYLKHWVRKEPGMKDRLWVRNKPASKTYPATDLNSVSEQNKFYRVQMDDVVYGLLRYRYQPHESNQLVEALIDTIKPMNSIQRYIDGRHPHHENLEILNTNFLEDQYGRLETHFGNLLETLNNPSTDLKSFLESGKKIVFQQLIALAATQALRTSSARARALLYLREPTAIVDGKEVELNEHQKSSFIKTTLFIDSIRWTETIVASRPTVTLFKNNSGEDFLTSSSPVLLNIPKTGTIENPGDISMEMALGPRLALRIDCNGRSNITVLKIENQKVSAFNDRIYQQSDRDVYSTNKSQLDSLQSTF